MLTGCHEDWMICVSTIHTLINIQKTLLIIVIYIPGKWQNKPPKQKTIVLVNKIPNNIFYFTLCAKF